MVDNVLTHLYIVICTVCSLPNISLNVLCRECIIYETVEIISLELL